MPHHVVQLTDCHLFTDREQALRGVVTWPRLIAALEHVRRQVPNPDLLVFTGDTAHDEARDTYESVRNALSDWSGRVRILPGNHDDRALLKELFPQPGEGAPGRVTFHAAWDDWQVIGLDSQQPGLLPGTLGAEQLEWLRERLRTARIPTLLFVHHPPIAVNSPWLDDIGMQDAAELERLLVEHPQVRLVACGHVHQEVVGGLGHATVVTTPAVGPRFRPRTEQLEIAAAAPAIRLFELRRSGDWTSQVLDCPPA